MTATAAPADPGTRRRWARRAAVVVVLVGLLALEARSVLWFHAPLPWSVGAPDVPLQRLADGPLYQPLSGHPAAASYRAYGAPCTMQLYLPEGDGHRTYVLVGGP